MSEQQEAQVVPAILELKDGTRFDVLVPMTVPRIISGWASELGLKLSKDRLIFGYYRTTIIRPIYQQEDPEKFALEKK